MSAYGNRMKNTANLLASKLRSVSFLVCIVVAFSTSNARGCDDVLGICLKTYGQSSGAIVTKVSGQKAQNLRHQGESTRYTLVAGQHVITAVNGAPVANADECVEALKNTNGRDFTIDVLNTQRNTVKTYISYQDSSSAGGASYNKPSTNYSNNELTDHSNLTWNASVGDWVPAPGYAWSNKNDHSLGVRWKANLRHPDYKGVVSSRTVGKWVLRDGYEWASSKNGDLRTRYVGEQNNNTDSDSNNSSVNGSNSGGFSNQDAWRLNNLYQHSPYNHWGTYGPRGY